VSQSIFGVFICYCKGSLGLVSSSQSSKDERFNP
jgi:hypothetical protein